MRFCAETVSLTSPTSRSPINAPEDEVEGVCFVFDVVGRSLGYRTEA